MRLVLAEDQALLRVGLTRILEDSGFEVVAAVDNGPSLEKALADPTIEAAVVDVRLPPTFTNEGLAAAIDGPHAPPGLPGDGAQPARRDAVRAASCSPAARAPSATCSRTASPTSTASSTAYAR